MKKLNVLVLAVLLGACASTDHLQVEPRDLEQQTWQKLPNLSQRLSLVGADPTASMPKEWWHEFEDDNLSAVISVVLEHSYDMRIAAKRLESLRQTSRASSLAQFPRLTAEAGYSDERRSLNRSDFPIVERDVETYNAGLAYEWEVDVFRRVNKQAQLDDALYQVSVADQLAVRSMLVADVIRSYVSYRQLQMQLILLEQQIERQAQRLALYERLDELGQTSEAELLVTSAQLSALQASRDSLQAQKLRQRYELKVLAGGRDLSIWMDKSVESLPKVPNSVILLGLDAALQQRPDVAAAYHRLKAAIASFQITHSLWWPRLSLNGTIGYVATDFDDIGKSSSEARLFNPRLSWSGLNFLSLRAKIKSANAQAEVQLLEYEKTVTRAINEVQGAIQLFGIHEQQVVSSRKQADYSEQAAGLTQARFDKGIGNQFDVYSSQDTHSLAKIELLNAEFQLLLRLVDVYRAMGI